MDVWIISLFLLILCTRQNKGGATLSLELDRLASCSYENVHGMYGAHCASLRLTKVPPRLKSSIEVLDASDNKIRELKADTFDGLRSIRFLYLNDNPLYLIDSKAFSPLSSLESLDLSQISLKTIPKNILDIPTLRNLKFNGNALLELDLQSFSKPIAAPLEYLSLADCSLTKVPDFGVLPYLKSYNLSMNPLASITATDIARSCSVMLMDLRYSVRSLNSTAACGFKLAYTWLKVHAINVSLSTEDYSFMNTKDFNECNEEEFSDVSIATFKKCKSSSSSTISMRFSSVKINKWLLIAGGLAGFLVGFLLLLYALHLGNVRQTKKINKHANRAIKEASKQEEHEKLSRDVS